MDYLFPHYFDRIVVINLAKNPERFTRIADELKHKCLAGPDDIVRHEAVHGDSMPHPAWYRAGNGAWGCLSSHIEVLEDAWNTGSEHTLIIEDDTVFADDLLTRFPEIMKEVPKEYGQLYLGGQHQQAPAALSDTLWRGTSINRTHCYAVTRKFIPEILAHIMDWDTHIKAAGNPLHIDHTLEIGHQRRYWPVFCPRFWFAGQGENQSDINGRPQREMWWEYSVKQQYLELPLLVLRTVDTPKHIKDLVFAGWPTDLDARGVNKKIEDAKKDKATLLREISWLAYVGFQHHSLPAVYLPEPEPTSELQRLWSGEVVDTARMDDADIHRMHRILEFASNPEMLKYRFR